VNISKLKFSKWRLAVLWKFTDKEISEIKINSVPNNTKDLCKNTKTIIHLRLGDYRRTFTSTSSGRILPDNHLAFGEKIIVKYQYEWNWENEKLCGNMTPEGRSVFTQFRVFPFFTSVDITVYQYEKIFIFVL
jgi:hypothetical protein